MADLVTAEDNARLAFAQGPQTCVAMTAAEAVGLFERLRAAEAERDGQYDMGEAYLASWFEAIDLANARDAALEACATRIAELLAEVAALTERRDALLALIASISQSTPLPSELEGWEGQRAALVAEIGTLRAQLAASARAAGGRP